MIEQYQLLEDQHRGEWRLLRQGAAHAESIFLSLDEAIRKLPDAVGNISTVVEIFDSKGVRFDCHVINRQSVQTFNQFGDQSNLFRTKPAAS